jgi:hypothetical protein
MSTLALVVAKGTPALGSGLSAGLVPAIGAHTLEGFAVGMLLSGVLLLALTTQRHGPLRGLKTTRLPRPTVGMRLPRRALGTYPAPPAQVKLAHAHSGTGDDFFARPESVLNSGLGDEPEAADEPEAGKARRTRRSAGYRSKHRLTSPEDGRDAAGGKGSGDASPWPENRRRAPRHAAPPTALASRMTGVMQVKALAIQVRTLTSGDQVKTVAAGE